MAVVVEQNKLLVRPHQMGPQVVVQLLEAEVLVEKLGLSTDLVPVLGAVPVRGTDRDVVSQDPTIYRLYEALAVYGPALKELIHEQFGDGIMSAINFSVDVDKRPHPSGDRVVITFDGKFLPYDWVSAD